MRFNNPFLEQTQIAYSKALTNCIGHNLIEIKLRALKSKTRTMALCKSA